MSPASLASHYYETSLRESEFWTPEQFVEAADAGGERVAFTAPAQVPAVHLLRKEDRVWRPQDYDSLPTKEAHSPGYTLLRNVDVVAPGMALAPDGRFISDALTRLNPRRLSTARVRDLEVGASARAGWETSAAPIERGILVAGAGMDKFGHQLLDFLPGLAMLERNELYSDWPLLMPSQAPEWVSPMVDVFCGRRRRIHRFSYRRDLRQRVAELCVPWIVRRQAFHPDVASVFERIVKAVTRGQPAERRRRIFIIDDPGGPDKRRLENPDQVEALLRARGLEGVSPQRLPFAEQVRLFAETEVAVGQAGSALHGVVFSKPGSKVVELRPQTYIVHGQTAIAVLKRQIFASVSGSQAGGRMSLAPWRLDPEAVERRLDELGL